MALTTYVVDQHRDGVGESVGHREVERPIAVEVPYCYRKSTEACAKTSRDLEAPIPVAQKNRDGVGDSGHSEVERTIAVEVPHGHRRRTEVARVEAPRGLEAPVPVAQKHRDVAGAKVGYGEVERAIAVEVPHRHRRRTEVPRDAASSLEDTTAVQPRQRHGCRPLLGDYEVERAI